MSNLNSNYDNDFDSFLNLDSSDYTPISASPVVKPSLTNQSSSSSANTFATSSHQSFSGPSYQYDSHRQQTGLPIGGLANTFAVNQATGLHYRPGQMGFVMPTETLNIPLSNTFDDFDFTRNQIDMGDMDFDADSPSDVSAMLYSAGGESSQSAPVQRMYPGMHSQQAKARQEEMLRQQQQQQQQPPKQLAGQRSLPTQAPKAPGAKDPHVEESISRLLNRMRQSSTTSAEESTPSANGMSGMTRPKKEEDDMDDDERLLASEEGKKLSSKERRQLRNKVSARAFRSRRKEYIGQLEGEVAQKVQEANDLRVQNRQLMEENTRLTDLTRMLLSSQAFSGFLQELSNSGLPAPNLSAAAPAQSTQARKDVGIHEASRQLQSQNHQHVGMTMIPENTIDMSGLDFGNSNFASLPSNDFQVFAVTALPPAPALDMGAMTEKKPSSSKVPSKDAPTLSALPSPIQTKPSVAENKVDECVTLDKKAFDLYYDAPSTSVASTSSAQSFIASLSKPEHQTEPSADKNLVPESTMSLDELCAELEEACERLAKFLP